MSLNGPKVVIVSDALWQRLFHRDRAILGTPIKLDGDTFTDRRRDAALI